MSGPFDRAVRSVVRAILKRGGYRAYKQSMLPWGVDHILDIQRLSQAYDHPIRTVIDVGANVGQAAKVFLKEFPDAGVHSFEPHPSTFAKLSQNCQSVRLHTYNFALGSEEGEHDFYDYGEEESLLNSLVAETAFTRRYARQGCKIRINARMLDEFCVTENIPSVDLLKIDTEGYEEAVLRGANALLTTGSIKFVYFEFNRLVAASGGAGTSLIDCDRILSSHGYRFVAAYTDWVDPSGELFAVRNALYVLQ